MVIFERSFPSSSRSSEKHMWRTIRGSIFITL